MKTKAIIFLVLTLITSLTITACDEMRGLPVIVDLENSIKEIIDSKGNNYNFLNDELYMDKMRELVNLFVKNDFIKEEHYVIGNLNGDSIPELVVFRERNPKNVDDQGTLELYAYEAGKYNLVNRIPMNYDNTNYQLVIGEIGHEQSGILLNNQVGSQSGITYGFILDEGKLVSVLNEKKVNLVSINTDNEIKDIDDDGILEFSINTINPESTDQTINSPDKIRYWYRWDGSDGAELVKYENLSSKSIKEDNSDDSILKEAKRLFSIDRTKFLEYLKNNKDYLSNEDTTLLMVEYFSRMKDESSAKGVIINNLFSRYQLGNSNDYLFNKYGLSLENLNDIAFLNREKVLSSEIELKNNLIHNIKLGFKLRENAGKYNYTINYQVFLDSFGDNILREYKDYYRILALDSSNPYLKNDTLLISRDKLVERIILIDNFIITYPYSEFIDELSKVYNNYLNILLYGSKNSPIFVEDTNTIDSDILEEFKAIEEKYANSNLASIVSKYIKALEANDNKIDKDIKKKLNLEYLR